MRRRTFLGGTPAAFAPRPFGHALAASDAAASGGRRELVADGYDTPPLLEVARGRTVHLRLRNDTAFVHPVHLHGHHVKLLSVDGRPPARTVRHDSVPLAPDQAVEVAFVADNPGRWLSHCDVLEHHMAGMGTIVTVVQTGLVTGEPSPSSISAG